MNRALPTIIAVFLTLVGCVSPVSLALPIGDGEYVFKHRYVEQPNIESITLMARIDGTHIVLMNHDSFDVFPEGKIEEGTLFWHAATKQWIIVHSPTDRTAVEVGGCSGGPPVIDLQSRIYWTC